MIFDAPAQLVHQAPGLVNMNAVPGGIDFAQQKGYAKQAGPALFGMQQPIPQQQNQPVGNYDETLPDQTIQT